MTNWDKLIIEKLEQVLKELKEIKEKLG